ncbi:MAG: glycosyltransferase family 4 protein [Methanobacteriota archaeon]|nr:MAG: glycosyltransferase family 4 protein [Euryarchaeota archaeon]
MVYQNLASFVANDIDIIEKKCKVRQLKYTGKRKLPKLGSSMTRSNFVYCWFVMGHATSSVMLSKTLRKKSIVVAGGWDVIYLPEIDYGAMNNPKRIDRTKYALKNADRVLAVSESTKQEVLQWVDRDLDVVYNGVDTEKFVPKGEKRDLVVTVAAIDNLVRYKKKGIETFLDAAAQMPDVDFVAIGENAPEWDAKMQEKAPKNATITGRITGEQLLSYYQEAKVYAQISYHESFGVALAEGMSCGCVPVATDRFALPEVVGDTGFYSDYGDVEGTVEAINKALESKDGDKCRQRVIDNFRMEIREKNLHQIIAETLNG